MLLVFIAHAKLDPFNLGLGKLGVTIFFFVSGYIITTLLRQEYTSRGKISFRKFYLRRIYRLMPPFYAGLAVSALLTAGGIFSAPVSWQGTLAQVFQVTNYYIIFNGSEGILEGTYPLWSLAVEEHFYLLYPALFLLLVRRYPSVGMAGILVGLCLAALAWRSIIFSSLNLPGSYSVLATDARLDSLLFGCIMGVWSNPAIDGFVVRQERARVLLCLACVLLLFGSGAIDSYAFKRVGLFSVQGIALFFIVGAAIQDAHHIAFRWLNHPALVYMGTVSYTFYIVHLMTLKALWKHTELSVPGAALIGFVLALAFSAASWHIMEKPLADLRKKLHN